jgi:hypothetical protein
MNSYYGLKEIKDIFKLYKPSIDSSITKKEFNIFCKTIIQLPKDILDRISKDIFFVLLSANPKCLEAACLLNLDDRLVIGKKAIIIITPILFGYKARQNSPGSDYILHEVAHYVLGHRDYLSQEDIDKKESEANDLASKWIADYFLAIDRESEK